MGEKMATKAGSSDLTKIARERIRILFQRAEEVVSNDPELANRYVFLARRIAMRHRIRIPRDLRRRFCRYCYAYLVPGMNARARIHRGKVVVTCRICGRQRRYPLRTPTNHAT